MSIRPDWVSMIPNWKTPSPWQRFLVALLIIAAASAFRIAFFGGLDRGIPFLLYYPARVCVTHGGVLAGVGGHLGPIRTDRDLAELGELQFLGQFQHLDKAGGEQRLVLATKRAKGVVIWVRIGRQQTNGHVIVRRLFDPARTEHSGGIAVDKQRQQHRGWILGVARAAGVHFDLAQVEPFDGVDDEMHQVVRRHPVAQVRRK
jgi:hypothetical protein